MVRKKRSLATSVLLWSGCLAHGQTPLCAGMLHGPTISDVGAASCVYDVASDAAIITFNRAAVLDWERVSQSSGSSLSFQFLPHVGNATVLNRLSVLNARLGDHRFGGSLASNGRVVILSPQTGVSLSGDITVGELVTVVSEVAPAGELALLEGGQSVDFIVDLGSQSSPTTRLLTVANAEITSTSGDVVLGAARSTNVLSSTRIVSEGATRIFSGNQVRYEASSSSGEGIEPLSGNLSNAVLQSGTIDAGSDVEISAAETGQILVSGPLTANEGNGRIFLRVNHGTIDLGSNVILAGTLESTGAFESTLFEGNEGDTPATSSPSVGLFPALRSGDATDAKAKRSKAVKVFQGAPVVASSEASQSSSGSNEKVARQRNASENALVRRSGFFGLRSAKVSKR